MMIGVMELRVRCEKMLKQISCDDNSEYMLEALMRVLPEVIREMIAESERARAMDGLASATVEMVNAGEFEGKTRDRFAAAALTGILSSGLMEADDMYKVFSEGAYKFADAMLAERDGKNPRPVEIGFDGPGGTRITGRVVGEDGGDWILDLGAEGLIRRKKQGGEDV